MEHLCKNCGKVIIPGKTLKGKFINFDAGQPGYLKTGADEYGVIAEMEPDVLFDHDKLCRNAGSDLQIV